MKIRFKEGAAAHHDAGPFTKQRTDSQRLANALATAIRRQRQLKADRAIRRALLAIDTLPPADRETALATLRETLP